MLRVPGRAILRLCATAMAATAAACVTTRQPALVPAVAATPPALVLGEFVDDHGNRYTITAEEWFHHPALRYRIVNWNLEQQYAIAQNAPTNFRSPDLWTRIEWMPLSGILPYEWAFCLSAYDAPTAQAAEATGLARREQPKTGCNGFPFSRMRRVQGITSG